MLIESKLLNFTQEKLQILFTRFKIFLTKQQKEFESLESQKPITNATDVTLKTQLLKYTLLIPFFIEFKY